MKYYRPKTTAELFELLENEQGSKALLAGGTDLMPRYEQGRPFPDLLIDLKHLPEMSEIHEEQEEIIIGALTSVEDLKKNPLIRRYAKALSMAAGEFAAVQIRHRATIGGNLMNASPAGDLIPPLNILNAGLMVSSRQSVREIPIDEFHLGPGKTALDETEILTEIRFKKTDLESTFVKLGLRRAMAISVVNLAASYKILDGKYQALNLAAGAVAPTVVGLEKYAEAVVADVEAIDTEIALLENAISPIDDIRATARYRRKALKNIARYTLHELLSETDE